MSVLLAKQKNIWYMYFFKTEKSLMSVLFSKRKNVWCWYFLQKEKISDVGTFCKNLWCQYFLQNIKMSPPCLHRPPLPRLVTDWTCEVEGGQVHLDSGECLRCHQTGPTNSNSQHPFPIQTFHTIANSLGICKDFASEMEKGYFAYLTKGTLSWCRVADRFLNTGFLQEWLWGR